MAREPDAQQQLLLQQMHLAQYSTCTFLQAVLLIRMLLSPAVQAAPVPADSAPKKGSIQKWENGFQLERLAMGKPDAKLAKPGKKVVVKYKGSLASNGKVFDETKGNKTFSFRLGNTLTDVLICWHLLLLLLLLLLPFVLQIVRSSIAVVTLRALLLHSGRTQLRNRSCTFPTSDQEARCIPCLTSWLHQSLIMPCIDTCACIQPAPESLRWSSSAC